MEKPPSVIKRLVTNIKQFARDLWQRVKPGPRAIRGAGWGMLIVAGLVYLAYAVSNLLGPLVPGLIGLVVLVALGALLAFAGQGIAWAIGVLAKIPWDIRWSLAAGAALLFIGLTMLSESAGAAVGAVLLGAGALAGAGFAALLGSRGRLTRTKQVVAAAGVVVGLLVLAGSLGWYAWRGPAVKEIPNAAKLSGAPVAKVTLPDPSQPGPYAVRTLTYGSGNDRYRPEYGQDAELTTASVDGSKLLEGSWSGFAGDLRTRWWGFGPENLPINGRVWYPEGDGPFPLALIVHGNHSMSDFSDPGYQYLGELLASRGFIFVSVDQNFINGGITNFMDGIQNENDARGWLLLEHLRVWQRWNHASANPFSGKVDMNNIAVMGHSRGGEAAAVAAAFNRLPFYPDNAAQTFVYDFNIKAVVAIAPIDGQYAPGWKMIQLDNVNYFVLHGSHDSDVSSFDGINVLERMKFTDGQDWFKSGLYVYRANHGQFNSSWGDSDRGPMGAGFLNRAALLDKAEQEQIARVYISAFLEATLHGQTGYLPMFADWRAAGDGWLPDTIYINRLDRAGDRYIATFEEDVNLQTATMEGAQTEAKNFNHWREQKVHSKWSGQDTTGVYLKWNEDAVPSYQVTLPERDFSVSASDLLIFNMADANQDPGRGKSDEADETAEEPQPAQATTRQPVDLTITLEDTSGETASVKISQYSLLQPQIEALLYKDKFFQEGALSEPVMQSYAIPLADFAAANPQFDPGQLRAVRFVFDQTARGSVILDNIGFHNAE